MRLAWLVLAAIAVGAYVVLHGRHPDERPYFALPLGFLALLSLTMGCRLTFLRWLLVIPTAVIIAGMTMIGTYNLADHIEDRYCPHRASQSEPCDHPQALRWNDAILASSTAAAAAIGVGAGAAVAPARKFETAVFLSASAGVLVTVLSVSKALLEGGQAAVGGLIVSILVSMWSRRAAARRSADA